MQMFFTHTPVRPYIQKLNNYKLLMKKEDL